MALPYNEPELFLPVKTIHPALTVQT